MPLHQADDQMTQNLPSRGRRSVTELRALIWLALPIIAAQMSHTLLGFVDTAMAGRVSAVDLAAVALGNSFWVPTLLFLTGVLMIITSKVAASNGAGRPEETGPLVRQAVWLGLCLGVLCAAALFSVESLLYWAGVQEELIPKSVDYIRAVALGFPAIGMYQALRGLSDGLSRTKPTMVIGFLGLALNVPANYVLVYGKLGFPAMGGVGCGVATTLVMWFMLGCMLIYLKRSKIYDACRLFERFEWPRWTVQRHLLGLGLPIGISLFSETSMFALIALLIGSLGAVVVASHQVALNLSSIVFMVPFSLGLAITVRVGHSLGMDGARAGLFAAKVGIAVALLFAFLAASSFYLLDDLLPRLYTNDPEVLALSTALLFYAALYQFSDSVQVACAGALRGYQDTRIPMLLTLVAYWLIGLPSGYILGLTDLYGPARGPAGFWQGLIIGLSAAALFLSLRLAVIGGRRKRRFPQDRSHLVE
ncbi:multidrug transporter [Halopseudomonas bauzanensis]|nr:multidrug transporter [Halopseudomonas bauzanensis]